MVNVKEIDMTTTILGHKTTMPMMLSAVAMCKLGHPEGETAWSKGASREGIIYMVPTLSGCSFQQIVDAKETADYPMFYQASDNAVSLPSPALPTECAQRPWWRASSPLEGRGGENFAKLKHRITLSRRHLLVLC